MLRFKAQQITAVKMVGKAGHVRLKTLASIEELILAAGHGCELLRRIFLHRPACRSSFSRRSMLGLHSSRLLPRAASSCCDTYGENGRVYTRVLVLPIRRTASSSFEKWLPWSRVSLINNSTRWRPSERRASKRTE